MNIKMLTLQAGPQGVRKAGVVYDVPDVEAKQLIAGGYAVVAPADEKPAAKPAAAERTARGKRGETTAKVVDPDE